LKRGEQGYFLERYGYGVWKETDNGVTVMFTPSGDSMTHLVLLKKGKKLNNSFVRKRIKAIIKRDELCDDRSKSRKSEFLEVIRTGRFEF
jgi:hypothetical protein